MTPLADRYGRRFPYLRLSIIPACNFRCTYCLPHGYHAGAAMPGPLSLDEIARLLRGFAELGMHKLRITGGEPSVRHDLTEVLRTAAAAPGVTRLAMTTKRHPAVAPPGRMDGRGAQRHQRQRGQPRPRGVRAHHRPRPAGRHPARRGHGLGRRPVRGETQRGAAERRQRPRTAALAGLPARPRGGPALHRADADRRQPRVLPRPPRGRRAAGNPTARIGLAGVAARRRRRSRARVPPSRLCRTHRHHRAVLEGFLRGLQPPARHRHRRPAPLPVRRVRHSAAARTCSATSS